MRINRVVAGVVCGVGLVGSAVAAAHWGQPEAPGRGRSAQPGQPGRGGPGGPGGERGEGQRIIPLEASMNQLNRAFRQLKGTAADPAQREQALLAVWAAQRACASAKSGKPEFKEGDPVAGLEQFRRAQIKLMGMLIEVEAALMDGKHAEAAAKLVEIEAFEEESHKAMGVEDEREAPGEAPAPPR